MGKTTLAFSAISLLACSSAYSFSLYAYGTLVTEPFVETKKEGYYRQGEYATLSSADHAEIPAKIPSISSFGPTKKVLPSTGEVYLTVIPVDFEDYAFEEGYQEAIQAAFFGSSSSNQYVSLTEYYDKASYHRLHVQGEVVGQPFRSSESYAVLKGKNNASQTKAALSRIYAEAVRWYNALGTGRTLTANDGVFFVYSAPYSGMDGGSGSRSSMMWAFAVNDPAPIGWASYHMMHRSKTGQVDAHTYIHEFGHLLGLKDYYDVNSYSDLSPCSPLGRMDMMDCSLGEHNAFSKMILDWTRPYIPTKECVITLRPSSGNPDCILLPLETYNGTPYDEYLLLEFYTPTYLNYADATLRAEKDMSLFSKPGIKAYHVDGRLALYESRGKTPVSLLSSSVTIGGNSLDLYCDNSGSVNAGIASSSRGFLIQLLDASSSSYRLVENYIASDHKEDLKVGEKVAHLRDSLFGVGQGIGASTADASFHKAERLRYGFKVVSLTSTDATLSVFPLGYHLVDGEEPGNLDTLGTVV